MLNHRKAGDFDVGFIDPNTVFKDNITKWPDQVERNMFKFLDKQHYKTTILFPYNFK